MYHYIRLIERTIEHSRTDKSILKKTNFFYSVEKKITELKLVKIRQKSNLPAKLKINKHKYTVTKRCPEKICYFEN